MRDDRNSWHSNQTTTLDTDANMRQRVEQFWFSITVVIFLKG